EGGVEAAVGVVADNGDVNIEGTRGLGIIDAAHGHHFAVRLNGDGLDALTLRSELRDDAAAAAEGGVEGPAGGVLGEGEAGRVGPLEPACGIARRDDVAVGQEEAGAGGAAAGPQRGGDDAAGAEGEQAA